MRGVAGILPGLAAGLAGGLFGVGGGTILVPILTGAYRLSQHQAHGTSLAIVGATSLVSVVIYALHGNVSWVIAAITGFASIFTARWGARLAARTPAKRLARAFAVLLIVVAIRMALANPSGAAQFPLGGATLVIAILTGALAGLLSGFMGVGGGTVAVPAFTMLLGMPQQLAQGTSLAMILVTAPAGAIEHHRHGNVVLALVPPLAVGAALGGPLASLVVQPLSQVLLSRAFAVFLAANAVNLWARAGQTRAQ